MTAAADRKYRARRMRIALDRIAAEAITQGADVYASIMDGTPAYTPQSLVRIIEANREAFTRRLERLLLGTFEDADEVARRALMPMRMVEAKIDVDFSLADTDAAAFFRWQALSVAEIEGESITRRLIDLIKGKITEALEQGMPKSDFMSSILDEAGVGKIHSWHLATVFNNNVATAASASTLYAFERNKAHFPGWEYMAIIDDATRPLHERLDGKKFAHGDWRYWPPIDHGCRCTGSPIDAIEWEEEGYTIDDVPGKEKPAKGFENHAVKNFARWVAGASKDLPDEKQKAIERKAPHSQRSTS